MKNLEIAAIFGDMADLLEIQGANPFRVRAYRNARSSLESLTDTVDEIARRGDLTGIQGIGKDLAAKIREYIETGKIQAFEDLKKELPVGLVEILSIPGIGPKTARHIFDHFGVGSIADLEKLASSGKLATLSGVKERTVDNILRGIELHKRRRGTFLLGRAVPVAREIITSLEPLGGKIVYAGSLRRMKEMVHDIDILIATKKPDAVMKAVRELDVVRRVLASGPTKTSVLVTGDMQVDVRAVPPSSWGAALLYFTGSKEHNIRLRERALRRGLKLNEYGLSDQEGRVVAAKKEEDIYRALDLEWIPPTLREDRGEVDAAEAEGALPSLVEVDDIQGDLHMHTTWSDGALSSADMVAAASERGYGYIALTDHSQSLGVAGGLSEEEVVDHVAEIRKLQKKHPDLRILAGTEVDIRRDGTLDYSDEILAKLDFVVASVHTSLRQGSKEMTARVVRAMENPHVRVIGHPTGRLLGDREGYDLDFDEIMAAATRTRTCLELNAHYHRLDLNDVLCRKARDAGVQVIISTDAHNRENLENLGYGVATAQRGWLGKEHVLNTRPVAELLAYKTA